MSALKAETVPWASLAKTFPSATTGGVVRIREEFVPAPTSAVQMIWGESPTARLYIALLAKPPDCGHDSLTSGAGRTTGTLAISLSGSSSVRSVNTARRVPGSGTLVLPKTLSNMSQPDSETPSSRAATTTRRSTARNTLGITLTSPRSAACRD